MPRFPAPRGGGDRRRRRRQRSHAAVRGGAARRARPPAPARRRPHLPVRPAAAGRRLQPRRRGQPAAAQPPGRAGADAIIVSSDDYARHSAFLSATPWPRCGPSTRPSTCRRRTPPRRRSQRLAGTSATGRHIGFAARFAAEKGVEYVCSKRCRRCSRRRPRRASSSPARTRTPSARRPTGSAWRRSIDRHRDRLTFLDLLPADEHAELLRRSATCSPSPASTPPRPSAWCRSRRCSPARRWWRPICPACARPCAAPAWGVSCRRAIPARLAAALIEVIGHRDSYMRPHAEVAACFDIERTLQEYEGLFRADSQ